MKRLLIIAFASIFCYTVEAKNPVTLFLVGDETMADHPNLTDDSACGWGQCFPTYLGGDIHVENHAIGNASTHSYMQDGHWDIVLNRAKRGDIVFIQLGLYDIYPVDSLRPTATEEFATNLTQMLNAAAKKGLCAVLFTPNSPCFFKDSVFHHRLGAYPDIIRHIALTNDIPLIDLEKLTAQRWKELGEAKAHEWFVYGSDVLLIGKGALAIGEMVSDELHAQGVNCVIKNLRNSQEPLFTQPWQVLTSTDEIVK